MKTPMSPPIDALTPSFDHTGVRIEQKTRAHQGFFQIYQYKLAHKLFVGGWGEVISREVFERGDAAAVLPYDPIRDEVVLIEQFRAGALAKTNSPWLFECVAGMIDANDKDPIAVIHREAKEEAGLTLGRIEVICQYWVSPGGSSERMHCFCGQVNALEAAQFAGNAHEHEDIRVLRLAAEDAIAGVASGQIDNATSIISLQWLAMHRDRLRTAWQTN